MRGTRCNLTESGTGLIALTDGGCHAMRGKAEPSWKCGNAPIKGHFSEQMWCLVLCKAGLNVPVRFGNATF